MSCKYLAPLLSLSPHPPGTTHVPAVATKRSGEGLWEKDGCVSRAEALAPRVVGRQRSTRVTYENPQNEFVDTFRGALCGFAGSSVCYCV